MLGKEQAFLVGMESLIILPVGPVSVLPLLFVYGQYENKLCAKKAVVKASKRAVVKA